MLLAAFLLLLAVNALLGLTAISARDMAAERGARYSRAAGEASELLADLVDEETGVRGYVITGDDMFLKPYERGRADSAARLAELRSLLAADAQALSRLDRVEAVAAEWRERSVDPELAAARAGDRDEAERLVATGRGRRLFDRLRVEVSGLQQHLDSARDEAEASAAGAARQLDVVLLSTFFAGAALLVATARLTDRWITRPLERIGSAVREVSDGQLSRRIPSPGPVDVAELGTAAEHMRRRIVAELDAARRAEQALRSRGPVVAALREQLQPSNTTLPDGIEAAAAFEPAAGVLAGDWYDVVRLEPTGEVAICVVDVAGHGATAGIFALQAKNLMLAAVRQAMEPGDAFAWVAETLGDTGEHFLTSVLAYLDPATGRCRYANAGHPPALVTRNGRLRELPPTGPLLGPVAASWDTQVVRLQAKELLLAYTDGVTEARGDAREEFGDHRLRPLVLREAVHGPQAVVDACMEAVREFAGPQVSDDRTLVALTRLS